MILAAAVFLGACEEPAPQVAPVVAPRDLRIGVLSKYGPRRLEIRSRAPMRIFVAGRTLQAGEPVLVRLSQNKRFRLQSGGKSYTAAFASIHGGDALTVRVLDPIRPITRRYAGRLELEAASEELHVVALVPFEDYVASTARSELGPPPAEQQDPPALMQAMRTAVRGYALAHRGRHSNENPGYDLCDLTHCMFFPGLISRHKELAGETHVLVHRRDSRRILATYFHSTCGGVPGGPEEYWPEHEASPHYRRREANTHAYCAQSPHFRWRSRPVSEDELQAVTGSESPLRIKGMFGYDVTGKPAKIERRAVQLRIDYVEGKPRRMPTHVFLSNAGRRLGWNVIKSNVFTVERHGDDFVFRGRGLGHGVGLCQWGARELARRGQTMREILEVYYPGARLAQVRVP